jgi:hypothetical protein
LNTPLLLQVPCAWLYTYLSFNDIHIKQRGYDSAHTLLCAQIQETVCARASFSCCPLLIQGTGKPLTTTRDQAVTTEIKSPPY